MKIQNVLYLTYDDNDIPSVRDTVDEHTLGTKLSANMFNPLAQELYNAIYLSGINPEEDNTRLYEALKRHKQFIDSDNAKGQGYDRELSEKGDSIANNALNTMEQRVRNNRLIWNSNIQGMQNALNHRLDRINAVTAEFSSALTGGVFPSATDTPQCLRCDGKKFDPKQYWQLQYALQGQPVPDLGGYFFRGASGNGTPNKVMTGMPDTVYFGVEVNADIGSFYNHHDTSYHIEGGGNGWGAATGCFQERVVSGWRWVYDNGGKKSKDWDAREGQTIGLNLALINAYRYDLETRPKTVSFNWVMFGGMAPDDKWLPKQPNPYVEKVTINEVPLVIGPGGSVSPGKPVDPNANQPKLTVTYNPTSIPVSHLGMVFGGHYWRDSSHNTVNEPAPTVTDAAGNVIPPDVQTNNGVTTSNLRFTIQDVPTLNGSPIPYYTNLFNELYGNSDSDDDDDSPPPSDPLQDALDVNTGAINIDSDNLRQFILNVGLGNGTGNVVVNIQCNSSSGKGLGTATLTFQIGTY